MPTFVEQTLYLFSCAEDKNYLYKKSEFNSHIFTLLAIIIDELSVRTALKNENVNNVWSVCEVAYSSAVNTIAPRVRV